MLHPLPNTLAVIVLLALIFSWFTSIVLALKNTSNSFDQGWYTCLILVFSLLGIPGTFDLLQTTGLAFGLAAITCLIIVINIGVLIMRLFGKTTHTLVQDWFRWAIPILSVGGLAVAGYFVFLELTGGQVVCGPVLKGCGDVQNSPYATLFGIIPMGWFGLAGYIAILASWLLWQYGPASTKNFASISIWGFGVFGVLFSAYLTFLEPFVIGSTCMWCITSAVFMSVLLLSATPNAHQVLVIHEDEEDDEFLPNHA